MITIRPTPIHCMQEKSYSCGAASFATIFNVDEATARKLCGTKADGTHDYRVLNAIKNNTNLNAHLVNIQKDYKECFWLETLSQRYPLYMGCEFISQGKRGRPSVRSHAIVAAKGLFLDPSEPRECVQSGFEHTFNKKLVIRSMIVIDYELPGWQKRIVDSI